MRKTRRILRASLLVALCLQTACTKKDAPSSAMFVVLNSGIQDVAVIGDSQEQVMKHIAERPDRAPASVFAGEGAARFNEIWSYPDMGLRLYFLNKRVEMIELQQPFLGKVRGTLVKVFQFQRPQGVPWDEFVIRAFGTPAAKAAGGQFGSEALFYSWGDISFNSMGPNQVAIYKTPEIQTYRINNFGKTFQLLNSQ